MYKPKQQTLNNLRRSVKNYNSVIRRMQKNPAYNGVVLPRIANTKEILANARSSKDIHSFIRTMDKLKDNKEIVEVGDGLKITKFDIQNLKQNVNVINVQRSRQRNVVKANARKSLGYEPNLNLPELNRKSLNFSNMDAFQYMLYREKLQYLASSKQRSQTAEKYKENYLRAIRNNLGDRDLFEFISSIPANVLYNNFFNTYESTIDFVYSPEDQQSVVEDITEIWQEITGNTKNYKDDKTNYDWILEERDL